MCLGGAAFSPRCLGGGSGHQRTHFLIISVPIGVGGRRCDVGGATVRQAIQEAQCITASH